MVYVPGKYNGVTVHSYQPGDSVAYLIEVYAGERGNENTFKFSLVDSNAVIAQGYITYSWENIPVCDGIYLRWFSYTGNGHNTSSKVTLHSDN